MFQVCTEGRLILDFTFDDMMRIKSWHLSVRAHKELVPKTVVGLHSQQDPNMLDQLSKNITRMGITNSTLNYLRVSKSGVFFLLFSFCFLNQLCNLISENKNTPTRKMIMSKRHT